MDDEARRCGQKLGAGFVFRMYEWCRNHNRFLYLKALIKQFSTNWRVFVHIVCRRHQISSLLRQMRKCVTKARPLQACKLLTRTADSTLQPYHRYPSDLRFDQTCTAIVFSLFGFPQRPLLAGFFDTFELRLMSFSEFCVFFRNKSKTKYSLLSCSIFEVLKKQRCCLNYTPAKFSLW